jgi:hypothetical protein
VPRRSSDYRSPRHCRVEVCGLTACEPMRADHKPKYGRREEATRTGGHSMETAHNIVLSVSSNEEDCASLEHIFKSDWTVRPAFAQEGRPQNGPRW